MLIITIENRKYFIFILVENANACSGGQTTDPKIVGQNKNKVQSRYCNHMTCY